MIFTLLAGIIFLLLVGSILLLVRFLIQNGTNTFKRKGFYIPAITLITITLFCLTYVFVGTKKAEKLMWKYLDEKEYTQTEIQSIDVKHSFLNIILSYDEWQVAVVYTDEPTSIYYYRIKNDSIVEGGVSGTTDKKDLKH